MSCLLQDRTTAWANSNWVQANFSDPILRGWVKALADPTGGDLVVRIGGGPQDSVVFAEGNFSWSSQVSCANRSEIRRVDCGDVTRSLR